MAEVCVAEEFVRPLELGLDDLCRRTGFPEGEAGEFKWSPKAEHWMRNNLVQAAPQNFFFGVLDLAAIHGVRAIVVIEDTSRGRQTLRLRVRKTTSFGFSSSALTTTCIRTDEAS